MKRAILLALLLAGWAGTQTFTPNNVNGWPCYSPSGALMVPMVYAWTAGPIPPPLGPTTINFTCNWLKSIPALAAVDCLGLPFTVPAPCLGKKSISGSTPRQASSM